MTVKIYLNFKIQLMIACTMVMLAPLLANATSQPTTWSLEQRNPFNVKVQQSIPLKYAPLTKASKPWKICALVPHLKDAYWIGIDYGLVQQSKQLNIKLELFEAGSYYSRRKQINQLSHCMKNDFDAILLGSVDPKLMLYYHHPLTKPVIALVNRIDSSKISTRVGVNWYQMGWNAGHYISNDVKKSTNETATLALLTGPEKQGGSDWVEQGIISALKDSKVTISSIRHADNNRNLYRDQLHYLLSDQTPAYILGSAVAIEAAVGEVIHKGVEKQVKLVSSYLSPAVLRGLFRKKVAYSSDDLVVLQGKLAIDVIVRELEGASAFGDIGPAIQTLHQDCLDENKLEDSLAPAEFYPIYRVN